MKMDSKFNTSVQKRGREGEDTNRPREKVLMEREAETGMMYL